MINFNELVDSIRSLLFGRVSIIEYTRDAVIYCKINNSDIIINGKLMIDKKNLNRINIAYTTSRKPGEKIQSVFLSSRANSSNLNKVLDKFEEYNKTYGYDPTIKVSSRFINKGEG